MRNDGFVIRPLETDAEVAAYFALAATTFPGYPRTHCTPTPGGSLAAGWRRFVEDAPGFEPTYLRGAFSAGELVGGYQHDERWLLVAGWRVRSGYVGGVVTAPEHRGRGVASALMRDGVAFARERRQALLVLRGIPDFYGRFGYADVMEVTEHVVERAPILALPASSYLVRPATLDDAPTLRALYERHYGSYTGSYARTLPQQEHLLRHRASPPLLALDPAGNPRGYLLLPGGLDRSGAVEVAADTWPAALALLQRQASLAEGAVELRWPLPPDSPTFHHLADHLPVRGETRSRPNAGWLARPGQLEALFDGLVPLWRERWRRARCDWSGVLALEIGAPGDAVTGEAGARCILELTLDDLRRRDEAPTAQSVQLSLAAFTQLAFGYRPARWAAAPAHLLAPLEVLFPLGIPWYPASNRC